MLLPEATVLLRKLPAAVPINWTSSEPRSEEHTSELQSQFHLVCRLLLEKKKKKLKISYIERNKQQHKNSSNTHTNGTDTTNFPQTIPHFSSSSHNECCMFTRTPALHSYY